MSDLFESPAKVLVSEPTVVLPTRTVPESWETIASKVPKYFRAPLIERAWKTHDETLSRLSNNGASSSSFKHITAETTAMADISAAVFMPLHLVKDSQKSDAMAALARDVGELSKWLKGNYPHANVVLIVGDQPVEERLTEQLDAIFEENPAKRLVCGPGAGVEKMVRDFAMNRSYGSAQIGSIDEFGGSGWNLPPGPALEKMVDDLLRQYLPDKIVAFEPAQMPAAHQMIETATKRGIPVLRIEGPSVKARFQPR